MSAYLPGYFIRDNSYVERRVYVRQNALIDVRTNGPLEKRNGLICPYPSLNSNTSPDIYKCRIRRDRLYLTS